MEKLNTFMLKAIDYVMVSIMWIVLSLPVFTIGASYAALYYVTQKSIKNDRGYARTEFWTAFKDNFRTATPAWLIQLAVGAVFAWNGYTCYQLWSQGDSIGWMWILFTVLSALNILIAIVAYPYVARFENPWKLALKNGILITFRHLPTALAVLLILALTITAEYYFVPTILFLPVVFALVASYLLERVFWKYMSEEDREAELERNRKMG